MCKRKIRKSDSSWSLDTFILYAKITYLNKVGRSAVAGKTLPEENDFCLLCASFRNMHLTV